MTCQSDEVSYLQLLVPLVASIIAAVLIVLGNYRLQNRIGRQIRAVEGLRDRLYDFLELGSQYWTSFAKNIEDRKMLEAKMMALSLIISSDFKQIEGSSKKLGRAISKTRKARLDLMDAATGGCFQQAKWRPEPYRVTRMAKEIGYIVIELNKAC
ncbi:MAG: hypothetical protein F4X42_15330 [Rhodospirillaceae bacterium]|nr:hypothetical protein [Rhodospirillaceae bacterium]